MAPPDPDTHGKIFHQELGFSEQRISHGTGFYSAYTGGRTSSRGQHPWPCQATQIWRTRASKMHKRQDEKVPEELGKVDDVE